MRIGRELRNGRRGYLYTIAIIMLITPLIFLLIFYTGMSKPKIDDISGKIRCDELYYFVEDVKNDLSRAMLIFGRRAAIYAVDDVVTNNRTMSTYSYDNCSSYVYQGEGSEAALVELVICGTLYGSNVTYMMNHTLPTWIERIEADADEMNFDLDIHVLNLTIAMRDGFNFALIPYMDIVVGDKAGLCYYEEENISTISITSIEGLEDPLYPIHTNNKIIKYIYNCTDDISLDNLAGCSTENWGNGSDSGDIVLYSNIQSDPGLATYCSTTPNINDMILVFDIAFGSCNLLEENCFDINHPDHLAGVVEYAKNDPDASFVDKCNVTIPWISAVGKIDNETPLGVGHQRSPYCEDGDITTGTCVMIKNIPECLIHQVILGFHSDEINTTCYMISNVSQYSTSCPGEEYPNGPSFFDRLDGRLNLSNKYEAQSSRFFQNPYIGLETLVSPYELDERGISVNEESTWIDYLYWSNKTGCTVMGICQVGDYKFKLDCEHAYRYRLDTDCVNASSESPVSTILYPTNDSVFNCSALSIEGTADDCDGDVVKVEVWFGEGWYNTTWDGSFWNYTWTPNETNKYVLNSKATDDEGVVEVIGEGKVIFAINCTGGDNTPPTIPSLLNPPNGATGVSKNPTFAWNAASDANGIYRYRIQVDDTSSAFTNIVSDAYSWDILYYQAKALQNNRWHWWRVKAQDNAGNWGDWSTVWTFKT
ncbi:MAG: hypothetical protein JXB14_05685 [Candidatus Altiarchaeota archaeon]|nr:hypothetical protein [Candidatus Altiarchaeota archaeon]